MHSKCIQCGFESHRGHHCPESSVSRATVSACTRRTSSTGSGRCIAAACRFGRWPRPSARPRRSSWRLGVDDTQARVHGGDMLLAALDLPVPQHGPGMKHTRRSDSNRGSAPSSSPVPAASCVACSIPTAVAPRTGSAPSSPTVRYVSTPTRAGSSTTPPRTSCGSPRGRSTCRGSRTAGPDARVLRWPGPPPSPSSTPRSDRRRDRVAPARSDGKRGRPGVFPHTKGRSGSAAARTAGSVGRPDTPDTPPTDEGVLR